MKNTVPTCTRAPATTTVRLPAGRRPWWPALCAGVLAAGLAGCDPAAPPAAADVASTVARPAIVHTVGGSVARENLRFPGRIRAAQRAELSFNLAGELIEFAPAEGAPIKAGEVVARIDPGVLSSRVASARAEFERASNELARFERLWSEKQAVSRNALEERRSRQVAAKTSLAAAERDLADATLRAPFDGVITRRKVENFASVQAKQPIAELQDLSELEVVINVPARIMATETSQRVAQALFDEPAGASVPLSLKSYSLESDPLTQTYEVVFALDEKPAGVNVLPGMAVTVVPSKAFVADVPLQLRVPLSAISVSAGAGDAASQRGTVWVVSDDGSIAARDVGLGAIQGGDIIVLDGLRSGERIVAAGVSELRAGLKVRPLDDAAASR